VELIPFSASSADLGTGSLGFLASLLPMTRDRVWDNDQKHAFWRETVKTNGLPKLLSFERWNRCYCAYTQVCLRTPLRTV